MKPLRDRDWGLKFFPINEEFPVSASHQLALITSLPFVHTARRYYRLNDLVRTWDGRVGGLVFGFRLGFGALINDEAETCPNLIL